jgi:hypothetical protein
MTTTYPPHIATFEGKHNLAKSKCLVLLYLNKLSEGRGFTKRELAAEAIVPVPSAAVDRWTRQGYTVRHVSIKNNRALVRFTIGIRGIHFVLHRLPPNLYQICCEQIKNKKHEPFPITKKKDGDNNVH